jgi:hypothetical protein
VFVVASVLELPVFTVAESRWNLNLSGTVSWFSTISATFVAASVVYVFEKGGVTVSKIRELSRVAGNRDCSNREPLNEY